MKTVFKLALILVFVGFIPLSCIDDCGNSSPTHFNIVSLGIKAVDSSYLKIDTSSYYNYKNAFKEVFINERAYISFTSETNYSNLFSNPAMACDPPAPISKQHYSSVKIIATSATSLYAENDVLPNQDIADRFIVTSNSLPSTINDYINNTKDYYLSEYDSFRFRLEKMPSDSTTIKFNVVITMTDGKIFELKDQILKVF